MAAQVQATQQVAERCCETCLRGCDIFILLRGGSRVSAHHHTAQRPSEMSLAQKYEGMSNEAWAPAEIPALVESRDPTPAPRRCSDTHSSHRSCRLDTGP